MLNKLGDKMTSFELMDLPGPVDTDVFKEMLQTEQLTLTLGGMYIVDIIYDTAAFAAAMVFKNKHAPDDKKVKVLCALQQCKYNPIDQAIYVIMIVRGEGGAMSPTGSSSASFGRTTTAVKVSYDSETDYDPNTEIVPLAKAKSTPDDIDLRGIVPFRSVTKTILHILDKPHKP